jgi:hypothetical protein
VDLLVFHAYQTYVATVGPGKPAGDAAALDAVLGKFLAVLQSLHGDKGPIMWDLYYKQQTVLQVITTSPIQPCAELHVQQCMLTFHSACSHQLPSALGNSS